MVSNTPRARTVRHLQEWIMDGRLIAGQRLPPEIRLASKLNVSRTTIRLALADLERQGLVSGDKRCRTVLNHVKPKRNFLSDTVALIMDSPTQFNRNLIHGTWHSNFIHTGAVDAIRAAGYDALTIHPDRIAGDMIQRLIAERPRGVIIMRAVLQDKSGEHIAKAFKDGNIPFVIYGDVGLVYGDPAFRAEVDTVISDHEVGAYLLTKWLMRGRLVAGYLVEYLNGPKPVDAIMAISDAIVSSVCAALRVHGKLPNRDVMVVGYDNMWEDIPDKEWEPLGPAATVEKKNLEAGRELMALLQERIEGKIFEQGQRRVVVPELVIRPSAIPG